MKITFNETHPELLDGEMFLTNIHKYDDESVYRSIGYNTKRKGNIAYTIDGEISKSSFPVFINKKEYDEVQKKFRLEK